MSAATEEQRSSPRVFISYSQHDPARHSLRVRAFAEALSGDGIDVELDQYHQNEVIDWPRWCEERLRPENSDFVLMMCSAEYTRRIENRVAADEGRGVFWEGGIIADYLYEAKANERFIPILLDEESKNSLPRIVARWTRFTIRAFAIASGDVGYTNLYRLLTKQDAVPKPKRGEIKTLPPETSAERFKPSNGSRKPINVPYPSLVNLFKGRDDFLKQIHEGFKSDPMRTQAITARHAIHGLGGIGKTRAAVEYAWRFSDDYTALLFVTAETPADFRAKVAALCSTVKIAGGVTDETARFDTAFSWLNDDKHSGWLLIVDNVDTPEVAIEVEKSLASIKGGSILITGRLSEWPPFINAHGMEVLSSDAATEFLLARTADKRQPHEDDPSQARELASELDGLALALEQAAAFIRRHRSSFEEYRRRWKASDKRVRDWHDAHTMQYERPLVTTWQTTIDILSPSARALLRILSWLAPEPLPRFLLDYDMAPENLKEFFKRQKTPREILAALSGDSNAEPETALAALRDFSLLRSAKGARFANEGQLHRVVALITRERQSEEEKMQSLGSAIELVGCAAIGRADDVRHWPIWDPLRPHIRQLVDFAGQRGDITRLMSDLGLLLATKAQYVDAEALYRGSLAIEESLGREHPKVATRLNNLARLLKDTNRVEEAEPLMRRALAIDEKSYGPEHPEIVIDLNNLALLLKDTNRVEEAEPLMRRALAIDEKSYGPEHPEIVIDLNNLALLLKDTNRVEEAEPLMRRALAIDEKSYGPEHPDVARDLNNLALLLKDTNRLEEAEPLMRRSLAIDEKSYGPEHPDVARDLNNLALLLKDTNRLEEAEPLMRRTLAISEKSYGLEHPNVARDLNNLALLLKDTNRVEEAEPMMRRALAIDEKSYGPEHPTVARDLNNLALLLKDTNRLEEAEPMMRRTLAIDEKSYGPEHPNVARDLNNLARLLKDTNRVEEAEPMMRRAVLIFVKFTRSTGHLHPSLKVAFGNYQGILEAMSLREEEIAQRIAEVGKAAGFDEQSCYALLDELSK